MSKVDIFRPQYKGFCINSQNVFPKSATPFSFYDYGKDIIKFVNVGNFDESYIIDFFSACDGKQTHFSGGVFCFDNPYSVRVIDLSVRTGFSSPQIMSAFSMLSSFEGFVSNLLLMKEEDRLLTLCNHFVAIGFFESCNYDVSSDTLDFEIKKPVRVLRAPFVSGEKTYAIGHLVTGLSGQPMLDVRSSAYGKYLRLCLAHPIYKLKGGF